MTDDTFDVFLSHNSKDKPVVRQVAEALRARGLKVWMDETDLIPGRRWIPALEEAIQKTVTFAVCIGENGIGPWVRPEIEGALLEHVDRKLPVIPILLPDAPSKPEIPLFLRAFTWVDLRSGLTESNFDRLERGIREKEKPTPVPASIAPASVRPRLHNLPYPPLGDLLKGRDEDLRNLETGHATAITQTQAISGLGGIGKTRLAVEYAWRSGDRYDTALFVVADSPEALRPGFAKLGGPDLLDLPEYEAGVESKTVAAVRRWLREHDRWLLILDNVDTLEAQAAVMEVLPSLSSGRVIITSRLRDWAGSVPHQELGILSLEEAKRFLLERTAKQRSATDQDEADARRLARELGGLPLALEQAAAYIVHHQTTFGAYLKAWENEKGKVLTWYKNTMQYPVSIAATWQTTLQQLGSTATAILRLTAFLAPDPIPIEMFEAGKEFVDEAIELLNGNLKPDSSSIEEAVAELISYSMVVRAGASFTVHRIVQEVLRSTIPEEQRKTWIELPLKIVDRFSPFDADDVRTWPVWDILRPHTAWIVGCADQEDIAIPTARIMNQLGSLLLSKGLYKEAEPLMWRVLQITENSSKLQDKVSTSLNNLAMLLKVTNRLAEAEPLMRRALQIDEDSFGPLHPDVARDLNNLALLLQDTNRLAEAEPLLQRSLVIREQSFGPDHPRTQLACENLAALLQEIASKTDPSPSPGGAQE